MRTCRLVFALAAAAITALPDCAAAADDCQLGFTGGADVVQIIHKHDFDFEGYDKLCRRLVAEGMIVDIDGSHGTIGDQAYS